MKININEEEVRHILKMHSNEREKTFLLKEDLADDTEKLRIAMASGCFPKGGKLYTRKDNGRAIYRVQSRIDNTKMGDYLVISSMYLLTGLKVEGGDVLQSALR